MNPVDNFPEFIRWFYQSVVFAAVKVAHVQFAALFIDDDDIAFRGQPPAIRAFAVGLGQEHQVFTYNRKLHAGLYNLELGKQVRLLEDAFNPDGVWLSSYANYIGISLGELHEMTNAEIFDRIRIKLGLPKIPGQP